MIHRPFEIQNEPDTPVTGIPSQAPSGYKIIDTDSDTGLLNIGDSDKDVFHSTKQSGLIIKTIYGVTVGANPIPRVTSFLMLKTTPIAIDVTNLGAQTLAMNFVGTTINAAIANLQNADQYLSFWPANNDFIRIPAGQSRTIKDIWLRKMHIGVIGGFSGFSIPDYSINDEVIPIGFASPTDNTEFVAVFVFQSEPLIFVAGS